MTIKIKITALVVATLGAIASFNERLDARQSEKASRSVWEGTFTKDQAKRGEAQYNQQCSSCHAADLSGNDEAAPLTGNAFLANWDGLSVGDFTERIRVSMPPNNPGKLSRQQLVDITSYILSFNSFPAGSTELDPKPEVLKLIRIEASKPIKD